MDRDWTSYAFNFPPSRRTGCYDEQLKHAAGEIVEASVEQDPLAFYVEVLDAVECLEGILRQAPASMLRRAMEQHYGKCAGRGDYGVPA